MRYELSVKDVQRFWSKVITGPNCWQWKGSFYKASGRPAFWLLSENNNVLAYRVSYSLCVGDIPSDKHLDHKECDNPHCVNPYHVVPATPQENQLRSKTAACAVNARKTVCKRGHPLVKFTKTGKNAHRNWRRCHICAMEQQAARREKKRQASAQSSSLTP